MTHESLITEIPNVKKYNGLESLPDGSLLNCDDPDLYLESLITTIAESNNIPLDDPGINACCGNFGYSLKNERFNSLLCGLESNIESAFVIAEEIGKELPMLSWLRGTSLVVDNGIAVLGRSPVDGMVGRDVNRFCYNDYFNKPRENPVIARICWKDIVKAARLQLVKPTMHHFYDVQLFFNYTDKHVLDWQRECLTVYRLEK